MQPDIRDDVVDFVKKMSSRTEISQCWIVNWLGINRSKYYDWTSRYGRSNEHNGLVQRDWWLELWERQAIIDFFIANPTEGYRRLTYMMMDKDVVFVSPATVYRVLKEANLLGKQDRKKSLKGTGFQQPITAHEHWHTDITYLNLGGTFYYLCSVLDGYSRYIVHWEIRESMKTRDVEIILQRAKEKFPQARPRIISDNGPQFIARDFKEFVRVSGMTHVRTSPFYPQSNGKQERMQGIIKKECIRPRCPASLTEAQNIVNQYVQYYNMTRLHSSIGYISPNSMLLGLQKKIHEQRDQKLARAREKRKENRLVGRQK